MPISDREKSPYSASKINKSLPNPPSKGRPALAVDTTFSQEDVRTPQQVYPVPSLSSHGQQNVSSLNEIKAKLSRQPTKSNQEVKGQIGSRVQLRQGPQKSVTGSYTYHDRALKSAHAPRDEAPPPYNASNATKIATSRQLASIGLQNPPKTKKKNRLHRPASLRLGCDISPSDRNIEIGLALSTAASKEHGRSLQSETFQPQPYLRRESLEKSRQSLKTPTIIVTPAEEDFEAYLKSLPQELPQTGSYRPRSSVYSRYTNCLPKGTQYERTPPVPPLPAFAMESEAAARSGETMSPSRPCPKQVSPPIPASRNNGQATSICTAFNEDSPSSLASTRSLQSDRMSSQSRLPTPRRSQGWWNLLVSPFSASSVSAKFFPSSSPVAEQDDQTSRLLKDKALSRPRSIDTLCSNQSLDTNDPHSAPPTECSRQQFDRNRMRTPKRSDTAPGALDLGNAGAINIYRTPSRGAAASYFDRKRSYPSLIAPLGSASLDRDLGQDWSPSQSVYRGSRNLSSPSLNHGDDRGFANMPIPREGEAAPYYDPTTHFPSTYERDCGGSRAISAFGHPTVTSGDHSVMQKSTGDTYPQGNWCTERKDSLKTSESTTRGVQLGGSSSSPSHDTSSVDKGPSGNYSEEQGQNSRESDMKMDTGVYPSSFSKGPSKQSTGISGLSPTSSPTQETLSTSLGSSRNRAGPPDQSISPQSQSSSLELGQPARHMGTAPSHGNLREEDFAFGQQKNGLDEDSRADSRGRFLSSHIEIDSKDERFRADNGPLNEKRNRGIVYSGGSQGSDPEDNPDHTFSRSQRLFGLLAASAVLLLVLLIVLLVLFIPVHHSDMPVQAQWLNLTGFPPLPTGVATIVGAKSVKDVASCVTREALWSCAAPPGERLTTTQSNQPNFRLLIRFRNGTLSNETLVEPASNMTIRRDSGRAANAGALVKRSAWSSYLYKSSPPPPSTEDQKFLGRTSDSINSPYDGEETPFYISLLSPTPLQPEKRSNLKKRSFRYPYPSSSNAASHSSHSTSSNSFPTPTASDSAAPPIPPPAVRDNGEPAPPELYPFAYAQPLRLFNRGQRSEHYGFYTYFDRSIYISGSVSEVSANSSSTPGKSLSSNVGVNGASAVCTWSQSRLLVQIWTGKPDVIDLVSIANASKIPAVDSSANDMRFPGSFPYAVTLTLDRHGGEASKKGLYCYELDENHHVLQNFGTWITEDRAVAGTIVNPAGIPTNNGTLLTQRYNGQDVSIDGGTSGCSCQWQNFS